MKFDTDVVALTSPDAEFGHVPAGKAVAEAKKLAKVEGKPITIAHPVSAKPLHTVKAPAKGKGAKTAKPVKRQATANGKRTSATPKGNGKPPAKRTGEPKVKQPKGMVVEILKLASRKDGVSPAELNKLTEWKGAPWKWLFSNPKGNGYCDRWGYKFKVIAEKDDPRAVRYHVVKR